MLRDGEGGPIEYGKRGGRGVGDAAGMIPRNGGCGSNGLTHGATLKLGAEDTGDSVNGSATISKPSPASS